MTSWLHLGPAALLWAHLLGLRPKLVSRAALLSLSGWHRAVPISEGAGHAEHAEQLASAPWHWASPSPVNCNPSSRSLRRCLFIGLSGNFSGNILKLPWEHAVASQPGDVLEIPCQWKELEGPV